MQSTPITRRALAARLAVLPLALGAATQGWAAANAIGASSANGLVHTAAVIRQQIVFEAEPRRVYEALTSEQRFDAITRLSDGATLLEAKGAKPTLIDGEVGGTFTLFGGYITGRHLYMLPNERLVQAWRAGSWKPGQYSIADFSLVAEGTRTRLEFEHRGFPESEGASLAHGWHEHYWEPLKKYLARG
jgi:activator of HSP90 ATPase